MDDAELLRQFQDLTLPFDQWTHRAHVKMAYLHLQKYPFDEALSRICAGIKSYNAANNVPESPTSGYNQTTTVAFLHLVAAVMRAYEQTHPVRTADEFCDMHPQLMSKHVLRFFYTPQRRMHPDAKTRFIEPDLAPLPKILHDSSAVPAIGKQIP
jgi:outer membrane protein assembly factor BamD (BamD/ComL family)